MRRSLAVAPVLLGLIAFGVPAAGAAPTAIIGTGITVTSTSLTLNGTVDAGGVDTEWFFAVESQDMRSALTSGATSIPASTIGPVPVTATISGLSPGTTYRYWLEADDSNGQEATAGPYVLTTPLIAPMTLNPSQLTGTSAMLAGIVAVTRPTLYYFEYGPTTAYGLRTTRTLVPADAGLQRVSALVSGLASGATYHYRLVVSPASVGASTLSADASFVSGGALVPTPGLEPLPAEVTGSYALVRGTMPPGQTGTYQFEYGTTTSYGALSEPQNLNTTRTVVDAGLDNLLPSTTYHYRLLLSEPQGVLASGDMTFTTDGDTVRPTVAVAHRSGKAGRACTLGGSASDDALDGVEVRVVLHAGKRCRAFTGKVFVKRTCSAASRTFVDAWTSEGRWMLQLPALAAGTYQVTARAMDEAGNARDATRTLHVAASRE